jgi:type IV pilus assembly protein PilM
MNVGLDIGSKTIKMVELAKEGRGYRLSASGIVGYKGNLPENMNDDKELALLAEIIKKLRKEAKITSRDVAIALPETGVYTRSIKFPLLTDSEIASAVKWEAEQYIPIPIEEAIIQHQIIEKREDTTPPQVVVLLVAVTKELIEKYAKLIDMAGLNLVVVETELMALSRALAPENQTAIIADFGARSTDVAIVKNQIIVFTRTVQTAGNAFTRAITQGLGVTEQQAEEYKRAYGLSSRQLEGKVRGAMEGIFRSVADEMKKAIHYYQSEEKGESPTVAIISGGSAGMIDITSELAKLLGIEVVVGNPFAKIKVEPEAMKALTGYAPFYSTSIGLAMRD